MRVASALVPYPRRRGGLSGNAGRSSGHRVLAVSWKSCAAVTEGLVVTVPSRRRLTDRLECISFARNPLVRFLPFAYTRSAMDTFVADLRQGLRNASHRPVDNGPRPFPQFLAKFPPFAACSALLGPYPPSSIAGPAPPKNMPLMLSRGVRAAFSILLFSVPVLNFSFLLFVACLFWVQAKQVIQPMNGDPFIGMLETPVTSAPIVASFLSNLPAYRTGVAPLLRGVEIGLTHGFFVAGPFIKVRLPFVRRALDIQQRASRLCAGISFAGGQISLTKTSAAFA